MTKKVYYLEFDYVTHKKNKGKILNTPSAYSITRLALKNWQQELCDNLLMSQDDLTHSFNFHFDDHHLLNDLQKFATVAATQLEPLTIENNLAENLPKLENYDSFGNRQNKILHHSSYIAAGDLIYASGLMQKFAMPGHLAEGLTFLLLSSHAGEAGHNCPIACSAGVIRILNKFPDLPHRDFYLQKLTLPSFTENFTGAQFLTEIQGGSDVGANACIATQKQNGEWRIQGEKWFCSNANADVILMTARYDAAIQGTKGLGLFLVPTLLENGEPNYFTLRRLKQKTGTRSMATAEIDFNDAVAVPVANVSDGIHLVLENVLHLSRIFNAFSVLGMARRAYQIAYFYAKNRTAFGNSILNYPLVQEQLAKIKAIYTAQIAGSFFIAKLQDQADTASSENPQQKLLLRLLVNLNKYFTAKYSVENIRHCIDILGGNGTIESFSILPRLLNDCIVCENWEGTHFTLWMQILRDIEKFQIDHIFSDFIKQELASIPQEQIFISENLLNLNRQINLLKAMPANLKTLKIQDIVLQMAVIYSSLCLLKEALHQQATDKNNSKLQCLKLFNRIFAQEQTNDIDLDYLKLIESL